MSHGLTSPVINGLLGTAGIFIIDEEEPQLLLKSASKTEPKPSFNSLSKLSQITKIHASILDELYKTPPSIIQLGETAFVQYSMVSPSHIVPIQVVVISGPRVFITCIVVVMVSAH